ncbi:DNA-3-methyladenine glycosylase isoform X3 [Malus sylvestris]|uniref:DNA-3-methyladenine glycosylase isoform X3 n=1 Tax=Malus sylvestris TaxID=3752 RepID=UPI0021ABBB95|nr:DNA-3-methyladenine glycosylase isoform X3 [Malus sylvestris]
MKKPRAFKRVAAKPKRPIPSNRLSNEEGKTRPSQCSESLTVAAVKPKKPQSQPQTKSDSSLPIPDFPPEKMTILPFSFFQIDALELAPRLLGKFLRREDVVLQITEVEAYRPNDSACHGRFGITARTAPVFGPGGHAYVYLCYGLHTMLNVVADKEGVGAAVLIRSCAPVSEIMKVITGLETIQQRRGQKTDKPVLLNGPGKIGQALGLSTEWSSHPLYTPDGLEILDGPEPEKMLVGPRVGIDYASPEHVNALWRFAVAAYTIETCIVMSCGSNNL